MEQPLMTAEEVASFIGRVYPEIWADRGQNRYVIEAVGPGSAKLRMPFAEQYLRPGGTISGPAMMALSDLAMWVVVLAHIGPKELSVTTNLNINFLRKPGRTDLLAEARLLKIGKRLATGDVLLHSDGSAEPVAHATCTYAIP